MRIGLLLGREKNFSQTLIGLIGKRDRNITLEMLALKGNECDTKVCHSLIIDRISHLVPYYRSYLKYAKLSGAHIINNPYTNGMIDIFTQSLLASKMGIQTPKIVSHITDLPLGNGIERILFYPTPWKQHIDYLGGFPIIVRGINSTGGMRPQIISSMEQFLALQKDWAIAIALQELLDYEIYLRCYCIGKSTTILLQDDTASHKYVERSLPTELVNNIIDHSLKLVNILDYDLCSVDWGVWKEQPFLIDVVNPMPDMSDVAITRDVQARIFSCFADLCVEIVHNRRGD